MKYDEMSKAELIAEMKSRGYENLDWYKKFTAARLRVDLESEDTHVIVARMARRMK